MSPKVILARAGVGQGSMYHHFRGKADLALAAITRTTEVLHTEVDRQLSGPGTALQRLRRYLLRERYVLNGCPIGRQTQDPDVMADPDLRRPIDETFDWLWERLAAVLQEGRDNGELSKTIDPPGTAAVILAVMQGGYVLATAAHDPARFTQAMQGLLALLELTEEGSPHV
jgi:TetR/AcrR family transcriptional repressor of nem operon